MTEESTIAALATPTGKGGIGIIRVSGCRALDIARRFFYLPSHQKPDHIENRYMHYGFIRDENGRVIDEVLFLYMKGPRSYTAEDVVEIHSHSSPVVLRSILSLLIRGGVTLAEPGEFTKRAYLNGRIDLTQAEAVIDMINARTETSANLAVSQIEGSLKNEILRIKEFFLDFYAQVEAVIDFPDEVDDIIDLNELHVTLADFHDSLSLLKKNHDDLHVYRDGVKVVIVGPPNSGKSSLLNALVNKEKAIVTPVPGTTRDTIEDLITLDGIPIEISDTAGVHHTDDMVEKIGIQRTLDKMDSADVVILLIDSSKTMTEAECDSVNAIYMSSKDRKRTLVVANKMDLCESLCKDLRIPEPDIRVSVLRRDNLDNLKRMISDVILKDMPENKCSIVPNIRHYTLICGIMDAVERIMHGIKHHIPYDVVAVDITHIIGSLDSILGIHVHDDVLDRIFETFCIGK